MNAAARALAERCVSSFSEARVCPDYSTTRKVLGFDLPSILSYRTLCLQDASTDHCFVFATEDASLSHGDFFGHATRKRAPR
jgi:hypothetical protein